jgi:hypothetical protein
VVLLPKNQNVVATILSVQARAARAGTKATVPDEAALPHPPPGAGFARMGTLLWLWKWQCAAILAAAAMALYAGPGLLFGPKVAGDVAIRADFIETVVASGHVEAQFRV